MRRIKSMTQSIPLDLPQTGVNKVLCMKNGQYVDAVSF